MGLLQRKQHDATYVVQASPRDVRRGFEVALASNETPSMCADFLGLFGEPPAAIGKVCNLGDLDLTLPTVYGPAR